MRPLRSALLRRLVVAALAVALGLPLAPSAAASPALAVLDDSEAFDRALAAAKAAEPGTDPVAVFAQVYADAVDGVSAEAVAHLLGAPSLSGVVPVAPSEALAKAQPAPSPSPASVTGERVAEVRSSASNRVSARTLDLPVRRSAPPLQPRAP
ncbi:hypothetical protein [Rubrivirga sp. IMCC43871]|uniref:hypothetical protein n=1 Tax=Rubrivirga sp. IMCC43871 TaxID=3391575 RepID=UPI003990071F